MQLAADPILIEIGGEAYELRPSLLAATRLARKHGDFANLYKGILADHVTMILDVIREGTGSTHAAADFLIASEIPGLRSTLAPLTLPLLRFVLQLAGHDDDDTGDKPEKPGKPLPFSDFHAELFAIGTGWLGWTPAATWDATPAEILTAQRGRTGMIAEVLKSVFGSTAPDTEQPAQFTPPSINADGTDQAFDRAGLAALKAKS